VSLPASASTHYLVTLPNGQTMEVDVPEGQTVEQVVGGPVLSATPTSDPTQAPAAAPEPLPEAPSQPATASEPASQPASEPAAQPAAEPAPAAAPEQAPAPAPAKQAQPAAPASSSQTPTEEPKVAAEEQQQTTGRVKANPRSKDEASSKSGSDDAKGKDDAKKHDEDGTATDARQQAPTAADPGFSLALPGPAPMGVPNFFIDKFRIPPFLLPIYQAAGIEYGVRWEVLAAINEIETDYGRNLNVSTAGAVGWMQFLPSSWKLYGVDANRDGRRDPYNPVDAIFATARYLKAAGAADDLRKAVFAYNHADWYVDSVLMRARLIGGLPSDLVGSLSGLTQGHFPVDAKASYADGLTASQARTRVKRGDNAAVPVESVSARRGIRIFAKAGSPVVAVQDGKIVRMGVTQRLGRFVQLRDVYGNTYTYAHLKKFARAYPVPKDRKVSQAASRRQLDLPERDPRPQAPASAGKQAPAKERIAARTAAKASTVVQATPETKERLFANPDRPSAFRSGGEEQLLEDGTDLAGGTTLRSYLTRLYGLSREDVVLERLKVGSKVIAGTILGRIGRTSPTTAPHTLFEIRPAGRNAPRIDPKPILDGWKLLESTAIYRAAGRNPFFGPNAKNPSIGQILLMSKEALQRRVLADPNVDVYDCGRRDIRAGMVDRRVLATLEFLAASGLKPTVTSLTCGHGYYTASGNVSEHSSGNAVDIGAINGIAITPATQGEGSITDITIRRLLTLQGTMRPHQIISLMTFEGADNTLALPDHDDHIHVGFEPLYGTNSKLGRQLSSILKPGQWARLIDRLGKIDNPTVLTHPSKYSLRTKPTGSSRRGGGEE
jgi:murein DD-endopeptidase MepM/ murein hydrolase activator NlpD